MVSPVDAAPDTLQPQITDPELTAPNDSETAGLHDGSREGDPPADSERDDSELALSPPEDHDSASFDHADTVVEDPPIPDRNPDARRAALPAPEVGRVGLRETVQHEASAPAPVAEHPGEEAGDTEGRGPQPARAEDAAGAPRPTQVAEAAAAVALDSIEDVRQPVDQAHSDEADRDAHADSSTGTTAAADQAEADDRPEPATDAAQPPGPPDNGDLPPPAADDLPDDEGDRKPEARFHVTEVHDLPAIIKEDGTARVLSAEEIATRSLLVPRGSFVTSGKFAERFGLTESQVKNLTTAATEERTLLARRITDVDDPEAQTRFGFSDRYLDVVGTYRSIEEIESLYDAISEVAGEEWGQYLAWGIRAEYHDAVRALGSHMLLDEAIEATGFSRQTLFDRDLPEKIEPERGRRGVWVVPVDKLIGRERWIHRGFERLKRGPEPVQFYSTREVADMLDQKYPSTIRKIIGLNLLPGVVLDAPFRDPAERQQLSRYVRIPAADARALRDYWEGNQRKTLRAVVRSFILDNPNQFTITRGRFEAYAAHLQRAGMLRHKSEVERLLGASDKFLEHYDLASGADALRAIQWNRIQTPSSRRVSEVDARTVRDAVSDVVDFDRKPAEVAEAYGVSLRTVYNWLHAASKGRI